jgi:hypothetical protein
MAAVPVHMRSAPLRYPYLSSSCLAGVGVFSVDTAEPSCNIGAVPPRASSVTGRR